MLYVRIFVPETKGKTIEEVQEYFSKDRNWGLLIFRIQKYDFIQNESFFVIDQLDVYSGISWQDCSTIDSFKQIFASENDKSDDDIQRSNEWKKAITMFGLANVAQ